ncbi:FecCD family ABC transporter permease [Kiloniella sp. b19]|uniref:FecCD family ABC transporter permease n=1 Tax=Kiloniella sp. GXU_MW_B19 TaxID=3141326 RepID=UPI0031D9A4CF
MRYFSILSVGMAFLVILAFLSVSWGSTPIALVDVLGALEGAFGLSDEQESSPIDRIIVDLRAPRVLLSILVGAGLGIVGCLLQTVTRNDLADPFLFGLSSGAAAGAVLVITVTGDLLGVWTLPLAAFCGGMLAAFTVYVLIRRLGYQGAERLVLAGLAVSFFFTAITNYLVFSGDQRAAHSVLFWSLGGMGLARWDNLPLVMTGFGVLALFAGLRYRQCDALLGGEMTAASLGLNVNRFRLQVFLVCAFATAVFVSVSGVIGFVGLMVPHMARAFSGPLHGKSFILSALFGALLMMGSDLGARILLAPQELPIGIITSSIGAGFVFIMLLRRKFI